MSPRTRGSLRLRLEAFERLGAVRRLAADCLFAPVRRFVAVRCLVVVRRFAAVRRFNGARFFRDERDAAASFLRFAISCLLSETSTLSKKIFPQRGVVRCEGAIKCVSLARISLCRLNYWDHPRTQHQLRNCRQERASMSKSRLCELQGNRAIQSPEHRLSPLASEVVSDRPKD